MNNLTIYILAGGNSSRMGTDKGLMPFKSKPMIEYIINTAKKITTNISIISNNKEYEQFGYLVIPDLITDKGPVGGIYTALVNSKTETNLIISCDSPYVSKELLTELVDNSRCVDICIASHSSKKHPLIGVYKTNALSIFKECIENNILKLMLVNESLNYRIVDLTHQFDEKEFFNYNSKKDLELLS